MKALLNRRFVHSVLYTVVMLAAAVPLVILGIRMSSQDPMNGVHTVRAAKEISVQDQSAGGSRASTARRHGKNAAAGPVAQDETAAEQGKKTKRKTERKTGKTGNGRLTDPPPISTDFVNPPKAGFPMFGFSPASAQSSGNGTPGGSVAEQKEPAAPEITLVMEGKVYDGVFTFEGNKITYFHRNAWGPLLPEDITVDGKPWKDLTKPFELDYTPDYAKAVILEKEIDDVRGVTLSSIDDTKKFCLSVGDPTSYEGKQKLYGFQARLFPFRVKIAMKNQLPHMEVIWKSMSAPPKQTTPPAYPKGSLDSMLVGGAGGSVTNTP
jgi:hypothetical protein